MSFARRPLAGLLAGGERRPRRSARRRSSPRRRRRRAPRAAPRRPGRRLAISSVRLGALVARARPRWPRARRLELVACGVEGGAAPAPRASSGLAVAAAALGLLVERLERPPAGVLVDVGDDVEREVEDPLEVAGADVEQDAEAARRALEVPDVADGAGQLDVAHPLAADLGARDLDAALVADDALVADPLVLPAVALPVLGGTEDALVEEAVLLRLERAVVDRLGLGDLALRPVPDLLGRGERDPDGVEVVDLEHRSPPRRRGPVAARFGPGASGAGPAERRLRVHAVRRSAAQSSNPARLIPPRSGSGYAEASSDEADLLVVLVEDLDVEAEALELLDEHLEGLGDAAAAGSPRP